ncbi:Dolichyl-phosphate-mannose-protein mannosyltransferase 2, partial [Smittium mucronatum]
MYKVTRRRPHVAQDSDYSSEINIEKTGVRHIHHDSALDEPEVKKSPKTNIFGYSDEFKLDKNDYLILLILTFLSLFTRLYQIGKRDSVTWDESHFGKFGAYYLNRTFYHDVHPPLAKMLVGFAELLAGHNGTFNFKGKYPSYVNYTFMRIQIALYGVMLVPFSYISLRVMNIGTKFCVLGATFILLDNALCLMSRFILLDEPLLFFTSTSLMFAALFFSYSNRAFQPGWYRYLILTGLNLGLVLSSKWVGLFCVALVGLATVEDLYLKLGDLKMPTKTYINHWVARIVGLIIVPLLVYMLSFKIHFMILEKSGTGDKDMFPAFQAHLKGNALSHQPYLVAYGSQISIRSMESGVGYLHSHTSKYPSGSLRQQVTCYSYDDNNGKWIVEGINEKPGFNFTKPTDDSGKPPAPQYVLENTYVRLRHETTNKYLAIDLAYDSTVESKYKEASCVSVGNLPEDNYLWKFVFLQDDGVEKSNKLKTISVVFKLQNKATGMYLAAPGVKYPSWGFNQDLVVGQKKTKSLGQSWVIEKHSTSLLADTRINVKKPGFLKSFIYLNFQMAKTNNGLIPDREKYNHLESDPITWPFLIFPMRLNGSWHAGEIKYYQIGNPLIWWSSTLAALLYPLIYVVLQINAKRNGVPANSALEDDNNRPEQLLDMFWNRGKLLWFGWFLHYLPFFLMGRVTYMHHYLPAQYFIYMVLSFELWFLCTVFEKHKNVQKFVLILFFTMSVVGFLIFMPFTFGYSGN